METRGSINSAYAQLNPMDCPFREFKDTDIGPEYWGMGPEAFRMANARETKTHDVTKFSGDQLWVDEQTQPLPRSARRNLHGWTRADYLAKENWDSEVIAYEEDDGKRMSLVELQWTFARFIANSSFCRRMLSACFMLDRIEGFMVEHQWENFTFSIPDGWKPKYHIYSTGTKPGGGAQHRPTTSSKHGCYLVRLFYLDAWRCVWVNDLVPVDEANTPLLPFAPAYQLNTETAVSKPAHPKKLNIPAINSPSNTRTSVALWPLLLSKALLKLAAPDSNLLEDTDSVEDELMPNFNILHTLTGSMEVTFVINDPEKLWKAVTSEVPLFNWDDEDEFGASAIKSKGPKKTLYKENTRNCMLYLKTIDTKHKETHEIPGVVPSHEMDMMVTMARDLPLKKPLPEPDVALWKHHRWVDWAREHGLYDAYDCPHTRFLKCTVLLKLSYKPFLLNVQSTESITALFRAEQEKNKKIVIRKTRSEPGVSETQSSQAKEELREWVPYQPLYEIIKAVSFLYYPSMFEFTSAGYAPPVRFVKGPVNRALNIMAPKFSPLYLQIDGPMAFKIRMSVNVLDPRVLVNCGIPIEDYIEPTYMFLETFKWFDGAIFPEPTAFMWTRGYDTLEVKFEAGRHFCRLWIHSRLNWHVMILSESSVLMGPRDVVLDAAVRECPWSSKFLLGIGLAFTTWIKVQSSASVAEHNREFFRSYLPDQPWNPEVVGYQRPYLHWMFRRALQSLLFKRLPTEDYLEACIVLRRQFVDPYFGLPEKRDDCHKSLRDITELISSDYDFLDDTTTDGDGFAFDDVGLQNNEVFSNSETETTAIHTSRGKIISPHDAATCIQSYWRRYWVKKCLNSKAVFTPDIIKMVMDQCFGNLDGLSALMSEFFSMYPGARSAYTISSALSGVYGFQRHLGTVTAIPKCKWVPFFQAVFYCHAPVKVHFDLHSTMSFKTLSVYNNDTKTAMPQVFNAHITFDFSPNNNGYTVFGHGLLKTSLKTYTEMKWQLTVLTSVNDAFHVCDSPDIDECKQLPLLSSTTFSVNEFFVPNRRNILGGVQIIVPKNDYVTFRVSATSSDLDMIAILRTKDYKNETVDISHCAGRGELYWPYIPLEPASRPSDSTQLKIQSKKSSQLPFKDNSPLSKTKQNKNLPSPKSKFAQLREITKQHAVQKVYTIEVVAPNGWPLSVDQWARVIEVRNMVEQKPETPISKKPAKAAAKESSRPSALPATHYEPQQGEAFVVIEVASSPTSGATVRRNDEMDVAFAETRRYWDSKDPGRNQRGAQYRDEFRDEFLLVSIPPSPAPSRVSPIIMEEAMCEEIEKSLIRQGSLLTDVESSQSLSEAQEETNYLTTPDILKDKFLPLTYVMSCTKEEIEDKILLTPELAALEEKVRNEAIESSLERTLVLQTYNEVHVIGRQKRRTRLVESLFVDTQWNIDLIDALDARDEVIMKERMPKQTKAPQQNENKADAKKKKK